jgi:hypothetical protein
MPFKAAYTCRGDFRSWIYRAIACTLAAGVCGVVGGLDAFLHPIRHPHPKAPNVPTLGEQIASTSTAFAVIGLTTAVAVVAILEIVRWLHQKRTDGTQLVGKA